MSMYIGLQNHFSSDIAQKISNTNKLKDVNFSPLLKEMKKDVKSIFAINKSA